MKIKKYTNILLWVNKKIKNDILPTKCHLDRKLYELRPPMSAAKVDWTKVNWNYHGCPSSVYQTLVVKVGPTLIRTWKKEDFGGNKLKFHSTKILLIKRLLILTISLVTVSALSNYVSPTVFVHHNNKCFSLQLLERVKNMKMSVNKFFLF